MNVTNSTIYKDPMTVMGIDYSKEVVKVGENVGGMFFTHNEKVTDVKPYLRPMSSMTEEEKDELKDIIYFGYPTDDYDNYGHRGVEVASVEYDDWKRLEFDFDAYCELENWLNAHHFDYRELIEKGLAIEAPADMYNIKND